GAAERFVAGEHFEEDHPERPYVRARVELGAAVLLWAHVVGRAHDLTDHALGARHVGGVEIEHLDGLATSVDEHQIVGFEITMHELGRVGSGVLGALEDGVRGGGRVHRRHGGGGGGDVPKGSAGL